MAAAVIRILKDPLVRRSMAEAGPVWIADRYRKERMVDDYERFFRALLPAEPVASVDRT